MRFARRTAPILWQEFLRYLLRTSGELPEVLSFGAIQIINSFCNYFSPHDPFSKLNSSLVIVLPQNSSSDDIIEKKFYTLKWNYLMLCDKCKNFT